MKMKKMAVLSAAAASLLWGAGVNAQTVFNYNQGDLLLGFRSSGASDLIVDIGSASLYTGASGQITISGNYYNSTQFSDANLDINNLYFSVFGATGLPSRNLWMTGVQSTPWTANNVFSQGPTAGIIGGIAGGAKDISSQLSAGPDNTASAVVVPNNYNSGGDTSYTVGVGSSGNLQGYFQGDIEGNTSAGFSSGSTPLIENLFEMDTANAGNPGKLIGDFELDPNGTLTFNPVPEPSTWATLGVGMMMLTIVRKFRRTT
jgi:hypothetical protein